MFMDSVDQEFRMDIMRTTCFCSTASGCTVGKDSIHMYGSWSRSRLSTKHLHMDALSDCLFSSQHGGWFLKASISREVRLKLSFLWPGLGSHIASILTVTIPFNIKGPYFLRQRMSRAHRKKSLGHERHFAAIFKKIQLATYTNNWFLWEFKKMRVIKICTTHLDADWIL